MTKKIDKITISYPKSKDGLDRKTINLDKVIKMEYTNNKITIRYIDGTIDIIYLYNFGLKDYDKLFEPNATGIAKLKASTQDCHLKEDEKEDSKKGEFLSDGGYMGYMGLGLTLGEQNEREN